MQSRTFEVLDGRGRGGADSSCWVEQGKNLAGDRSHDGGDDLDDHDHDDVNGDDDNGDVDDENSDDDDYNDDDDDDLPKWRVSDGCRGKN